MPMPDQPGSKTRLARLDYAKAIGIALVVFGHANRSVYRTAGLVWSEWMKVPDCLVYFAGILIYRQRGAAFEKKLRGLAWGIVVPCPSTGAVPLTAWLGLGSATLLSICPHPVRWGRHVITMRNDHA